MIKVEGILLLFQPFLLGVEGKLDRFGHLQLGYSFHSLTKNHLNFYIWEVFGGAYSRMYFRLLLL